MKEIVVLIEGFSSIRGKKRLAILSEEIGKEFPGTEIVVPEYFERYGRIGKYFRKKTIPEYSEVVYNKLQPLGERSVILIGYSMGGLVARYLIEKMQFPAKAVFLVGTPNKGVELSGWEKLLLKIVRIPCLEDMKKESDFLQNLGIKSIPNYYWLGSDHDERVSWGSSIPSEIRYNTKGYAGMEGVSTSHSGLIPKTRKEIDVSGIPKILKALKKEIKS